MATYHLRSWSVVNMYDDPFMAPELNHKCLSGIRDNEEKRVRTSSIKEANGREITTHSGSIYILEDMSEEYYQFLKDNNIEYDPENPITMRKK